MISDGMDGDLIEELMSSEGIYLDYLPSSSFNVEFLQEYLFMFIL
jgi:hypothetical protein